MITYANAKTVVEKELDLEEEIFVQDSEMLEYFNKARREAEAEVLGIYEDYLLTYAYLPLVLGTSVYSLPSGIYASKIRGIVYNNNTITYEIKRFKRMKKFVERELLLDADPTDYYRYIIISNAANGHQIEITPAAKENSSTNVKIWYLRKVDDMTSDTDYVDKEIPESINFIYAYVKMLCKQKENGGVVPQDAAAEMEAQKKLMIETLTNMVPDDDNEVERDFSVYEEMS